MKFLFLSFLFFAGCLRLQIDRYGYTPIGSEPESGRYSTNIYKVNSEVSSETFRLEINGRTEFWKSYSSREFIVWRLPAGYNFNFSDTRVHCECSLYCYKVEETEGTLQEYLTMYPLAVIWTLGIQLPFTVLDIASLPVRMFPRIERHSHIQKIYDTENMKKTRIAYEKNERMEKEYVLLEDGKEILIPLKSVYIPNLVFILYLYNDDGTLSEKRFIYIPENIKEISIVKK